MSWARQVVGRSRSPAPRRLADQRRPEGERRRAPAARRWRWVASVLVAGVVLAGCEAPRPDVTFFGNRTAVQTGPTLWCEVDQAGNPVSCEEASPDDVSRLALKPGQQVQINVPNEIGADPWAVYFRTVDESGQVVDARTEIFTDGRLAYTLQPVRPEDQLTDVEVRSFSLVSDGQGNVNVQPNRRWLIHVDQALGQPPSQP